MLLQSPLCAALLLKFVIVAAPRREPARTVRTPLNIEAVTKTVCNPSISTHQRSQELKISSTALLRVLGMMPYQVQFKS